MPLLLRWAPPAGWAGLLLFLGSRPSDGLPSAPAGLDKLAHLAFYAVLGALVARAGRRWLPCALAGLLVGAADELLQSTIASRTADWFDLLADVVGAGLGGWLYLRTTRAPTRS